VAVLLALALACARWRSWQRWSRRRTRRGISRAAMLADGRVIWAITARPRPIGHRAPLALSLVFRLSGPSIWAVGLFNLALLRWPAG
jgi:hypothetical protein